MSRVRINLDDESFDVIWPHMKPLFKTKVAFVRAAVAQAVSDLMADPVSVYELLAHKTQLDSAHLLIGFEGYLALSGIATVPPSELAEQVNGGLAAAGVTPFAFGQWLEGPSPTDREALMRHWVQYCAQRGADSRTVWKIDPVFTWDPQFNAFMCSEKMLHTLLSPSARHWRYNNTFPVDK